MLSQVELETAKLNSEFERARLSLNELWNEQHNYTNFAGNMATLIPLRSEQGLLDAVNQAPDFAMLQQQYLQQAANLTLQKANGQSDINIGAGVSYNQQNNTSSLLFSFSMPLQLSNSNSGNMLTVS